MSFLMEYFLSADVRELLAYEHTTHLTHVVVRDPTLFDYFVRLIPTIVKHNEIRIMTKTNTFGSLKYDHYYLTIGNIKFEFGGGDFKNAVVTIAVSTPQTNAIIKNIITVPANNSRAWSPYVWRMAQVIGMKSYSICLRNCEHIVNYVTTGKWISGQINRSLDQNFFFDIFCRVKGSFSHFLGMIPETIALTSHEVSELAEVGIVEEIRPKKNLSQTFDPKGWNIDYAGQDKTGHLITALHRVILLVGPTGSGKSRIVNLIFNKIGGDGVAPSIQSATSVNREMIFYYGTFSGLKTKNMPLCIIDTIGLCDSNMSDEEIISLIRNKVEGLSFGLNHVIMAFTGRLELPQTQALQTLLKWIDLKPAACSIFITKTDGLSTAVKKNYADTWNSSAIIRELRQERLGVDSHTQEEVHVNNFHLIGMPNPDEVEEEDQERATRRSIEARSEILMRFLCYRSEKLSVSPDKIKYKNLSYLQRIFGSGCTLL